MKVFYIITERNEDSSIFIVEKQYTCKLLQFICNLFANIYVMAESEIIEKINKGIKFYTKNKHNFTPVIIVDDNLKTVANDTITDNINQLEIFS